MGPQMNRRQFLCSMGWAAVAAIAGCGTPGSQGKKGAVVITDKTAPNPGSFSYCGIDCTSCNVFKATVHGDHEARMRAAKQFAATAREHWGMETLDPMILDCRGCRADGVQHKGYGRCPIRACAQERALASCGLCPEWKACGRLSEVLADAPEARLNLDHIATGPNQ